MTPHAPDGNPGEAAADTAWIGTKKKKAELTAIMRKLVILLNSLVRRSISTTSLPAST